MHRTHLIRIIVNEGLHTKVKCFVKAGLSGEISVSCRASDAFRRMFLYVNSLQSAVTRTCPILRSAELAAYNMRFLTQIQRLRAKGTHTPLSSR